MVAGGEQWAATTHDWAIGADVAHIDFIRSRCAEYARGGALHLVLEVLAYADDEAHELGRTGHCTILLGPEESVSVSDDGRGTDTRRRPGGTVVRKPIMSSRDLRFFDATDPVRLSDGLPRRGISVVAALSDWLVHLNRRSDGAWEQRYEHGLPLAALAERSDQGGITGTTVRFHPDASLVPHYPLNADVIREVADFPSLVLQIRTSSGGQVARTSGQ
ncbi:hypothetical protein [Propionicimonas sp.]|uniref:hypothetical protein n=1 Tax=Propionicimonas sp. TaxID=1955623 RepID=UPI0039E2D380